MAVKGELRTNEEWVEGLCGETPDEAVVADLREFLVRGLRAALRVRADVGESDIEDFAQEATMRVVEKLDQFRGQSRFTTWAMVIGVNVAYAAMRKRSWGDRTMSDLGITASDPVVGDGVAGGGVALSRMVRGEVIALMRRVIETRLSGRQRAALLAELSGMPQEKILEELGTNLNAMYKLYHDARKSLRGALLEEGLTPEDVMEALHGASEQ
ncbi:MAG: RNA polymerase sigma factor [Planctomycetota bacterium]|jgi:RNA polymerase sigma-70 factor (ECF subfamily)